MLVEEIKMAGLFFTFEGPDGAGKTTQLKILTQKLTNMGYDVVCTREPGGTLISDKIRELLLDPENGEMDARAEALLYAAARAQHVAEVIYPSLKEGKIVLCDRYVDSSLAYQGWGRELNREQLFLLSFFATDGLKPHRTFLLDIPPEIGNNRLTSRCGEVRDRIEQEHGLFRDRVRQGFRELAKMDDTRIMCIDACQSIENVQAAIWEHVHPLLAAIEGGSET
jgi:dTMP kinase